MQTTLSSLAQLDAKGKKSNKKQSCAARISVCRVSIYMYLRTATGFKMWKPKQISDKQVACIVSLLTFVQYYLI